MTEQQNVSPRRRMQELLAIPERVRTEEQWDELHELEISLAPGNRADGAPRERPEGAPPRKRPEGTHQRPRVNPPQPAAANANPGEGGEPREGRKSFRKRHRKPAKPSET